VRGISRCGERVRRCHAAFSPFSLRAAIAADADDAIAATRRHDAASALFRHVRNVAYHDASLHDAAIDTPMLCFRY